MKHKINKDFIKKEIILCIEKRKSTSQAAFDLGVTRRTIQYKIKLYREKGDIAFIHGNTGKIRTNKKSKEYALKSKKILELLKEKNLTDEYIYQNVNYSFFYEIVNENGIKCSKSFVRKIMKNNKYKSPEKHKIKKENHHGYREPKPRIGELVQIDGTPFDWFNNGETYCLQAIIDDASKKILGAFFTKNECLIGYIECLRQMLVRYGIPEALYADKTRIIFRDKKDSDGFKYTDTKTQLGQMLDNLGIEIIAAHSAQAKGRVERSWRTLQQRLPILFRKYNIKDVDSANEFLMNYYIDKYNKRFERSPKNPEPAFVPATTEQIAYNLKAVFTGKTDPSGSFSLFGYKFHIVSNNNIILGNTKINVCISAQKGIWAEKANDINRKQYQVQLSQYNLDNKTPQIYQELFDKIFLYKAKPRFKESYFELSTELDKETKRKIKQIV